MAKNNIKKTILYEHHIKLGAKMCIFSGFYMPLLYQSSLKEHMHVRNYSGIFDVSHMGKFIVKGMHSKSLIQYLTTNNIYILKNGQAQYTCLINDKGGIIDDLVIYQISEYKFLLIVNAINIEKNKKWIKKYIKKWGYAIELLDMSQEYSLLSIQGPSTLSNIQKFTNISLLNIPFYHFVIGDFLNIKNVLISRTGYTGSKGIEIYVSNEHTEKIWNSILEIKNHEIIPCGISSRDSLRLEMGYRLYGKDINENITPIESGLSWIVKFDKKFISKKILENQKKTKNHKIFFPFYVEKTSFCIPRSGTILIDKNETQVGYVTSGTFSPLLKKGIGLGYLYKKNILTHPIYLSIRNHKVLVTKTNIPFIKNK
ncbi:glycine cleavage system aminomethyltransferase GcvT [Blattabacterium cuenoti]|uniref:glycine cleavage system aminomethyltransferase GcvT n=1 Tax=Blattabacterium cuenoti TaxID=1653831 RepID=UPI00163BD6C0|nr:glycine cleavage system aminomethyltransferase GcvT [Blattabacterium cuenoti]